MVYHHLTCRSAASCGLSPFLGVKFIIFTVALCYTSESMRTMCLTPPILSQAGETLPDLYSMITSVTGTPARKAPDLNGKTYFPFVVVPSAKMATGRLFCSWVCFILS